MRLLPLLVVVAVGVVLLPALDAQNEADMGDFNYDPTPSASRSGAANIAATFTERNADFNNGTIESTNSLASNVEGSRGSLSRSRGWRVCWGFWRFKGCITFSKSGSGIRVKVTLFGRTRFNRRFASPRNFTIRIRKSIFPRWMRWLMRSDLTIRITRINLSELKACFQMRVRIRFAGTKVFPRRPYCVDF